MEKIASGICTEFAQRANAKPAPRPLHEVVTELERFETPENRQAWADMVVNDPALALDLMALEHAAIQRMATNPHADEVVMEWRIQTYNAKQEMFMQSQQFSFDAGDLDEKRVLH